MKPGETYDVYEHEIIHVQPAPEGWRAVFRAPPGAGGDGALIIHTPLMVLCRCWTERRRAPHGAIVRTIPQKNEVHFAFTTELGIESAHGARNFLGYLAPGERLADHLERLGLEAPAAEASP